MDKKEELLINILKDMKEVIDYISHRVPSLQGSPTIIDYSNKLYKEIKKLEEE